MNSPEVNKEIIKIIYHVKTFNLEDRIIILNAFNCEYASQLLETDVSEEDKQQDVLSIIGSFALNELYYDCFTKGDKTRMYMCMIYIAAPAIKPYLDQFKKCLSGASSVEKHEQVYRNLIKNFFIEILKKPN